MSGQENQTKQLQALHGTGLCFLGGFRPQRTVTGDLTRLGSLEEPTWPLEPLPFAFLQHGLEGLSLSLWTLMFSSLK